MFVCMLCFYVSYTSYAHLCFNVSVCVCEVCLHIRAGESWCVCVCVWARLCTFFVRGLPTRAACKNFRT